MKDNLAKFDWLTAQRCPAMAWHSLRTPSPPATEADRFRMDQGQQVGVLARKLYPNGVLVTRTDTRTSAEITQDLIAAAAVDTLFEPVFLAPPFVTKPDILTRENGTWHVLEVKSRFSDTTRTEDMIDDLAYTVMVLGRVGLQVTKASLVLISRNYCFGDNPTRLFDIVDATADVKDRVAEFAPSAGSVARALLGVIPPTPVLVSACRECDFFATNCLGSSIPRTVLEIPNLHATKLKRLSDAGIVDLTRIPDDFPLTDRQQRARDAALSGKPFVDPELRQALDEIQWPCHYLDFETVMSTLPLYPGQRCHQQTLTQFSIHHSDDVDADLRHSEYLANADEDHQTEVAEALIDALSRPGSIFVYSSFERTRINMLRKSLPDLASPLQAILDRLVDLLTIVTKYVYHPDFQGRLSIKQVLPALVPDLSYSNLAIQDGGTAIARFARMAQGEITGDGVAVTRQELLDYCKMDTLAMVRLHEALIKLAATRGQVQVARP